jgi:hypothetical protein
MPREPDIKSAADKRAMPALAEDSIRVDAERRKRANEAGGFGKCSGIVDVKNLDDGKAGRFCTIDQGLLAFDIKRDALLTEVGAMTEGFLSVDDKKCGAGGHFCYLQ